MDKKDRFDTTTPNISLRHTKDKFKDFILSEIKQISRRKSVEEQKSKIDKKKPRKTKIKNSVLKEKSTKINSSVKRFLLNDLKSQLINNN